MMDAWWARHETGLHRAGSWLILAALLLLLAPTIALGVPAVPVLVAVGALFVAGGVLVTHVPYTPELDESEGLEAQALTDTDVRERYVPPERLWSKP